MIRFGMTPELSGSQRRRARAPSMARLSDQVPAKQPLNPIPVTWYRSGNFGSELSFDTLLERITRRDVTSHAPEHRRFKVISTQ